MLLDPEALVERARAIITERAVTFPRCKSCHPDVRAAVDRALDEGVSPHLLADVLTEMGHPITPNALKNHAKHRVRS
jgi:hypothetical protein